MSQRITKGFLVASALTAPLLLAYMAYSRPFYFTSQRYLGGLILLEFLIAAVWMYRRIFFPVVILAFLLAGVDLPVGAVWTAARWLFLAVGALCGLFIVVKEHRYYFGLFHLTAAFAVLAALLSATESRYPDVALLKVLSLFLLFLYAGTGARIAVTDRENVFFARLILGCEAFVGINAAFYALGIEAMGNPNSLGAVMGVVGAPVLLWGTLVTRERSLQQRRGVFFTVAMFLGFISHSRAGIAAAFISCGLLCLALRKYKLFTEGLIIITIVMAATAIFRPQMISSLTSSTVYKGVDQQRGVFASRQAPWQMAIDKIGEHPWLGAGLGTTAEGGDPKKEQGSFASNVGVTTENGSSYLSLLAGTGILGAIPCLLLLMMLIGKIWATMIWMRVTGSALHAAVPIALVLIAGIVHAGFEDWMFAPGNYLSVFFWSLAFIFIDVAPKLKQHVWFLAHPAVRQQAVSRAS
ncbi:MAG TPA: O-antigen ligase family protein [Candidatus Eisenbacteria bacterium]|nr:O-antigen ligase family protein [Candidatus Eisenbacteria bacterium]